jgi:hypothetical protein
VIVVNKRALHTFDLSAVDAERSCSSAPLRHRATDFSSNDLRLVLLQLEVFMGPWLDEEKRATSGFFSRLRLP